VIRISIANQQRRLALDRALIRRSIRRVLADAGVIDATISLAVVDDPTIHVLNRRFLKHNEPTDVLSFVLDDRNGQLEGEIVVSADMARETAKRLKWKAHHELVLYIVHGMLHLVGCDDRSRKAAGVMRQRELEVLASLGLPPPPDR
jgi:probable rRNA maturation factor